LENEDDHFYKSLDVHNYLDVSLSTRQQEKLIIQTNVSNRIGINNKEAQILQPININLADSLYQSNNSAFESYRPSNMYSIENCNNQFNNNEHVINTNNNEYHINSNNNFENNEYSETHNQIYNSNNSLENALIDMENSFNSRSSDLKQIKYLNYNHFSNNSLIDMNSYQQKASYQNQYDGNNNDYNYSDYNNSNCIDTYNNNNHETYNNESSFHQFSNLAQSNTHYYSPFYQNYQLPNEYYNSYQNFNNSSSSLALDASSACYSNTMMINNNDGSILNFNRNQVFN
jgi:hypothetical protein